MVFKMSTLNYLKETCMC